MSRYRFTSESVTEGHPDKVCDQISDAIVDACLSEDQRSKVAVETVVKSNHMLIVGEVTTEATIDAERIARDVVREIGYTDPALGFDADSCRVDVFLTQQSPDIARGVEQRDGTGPLGAGDQGMMFGYATPETDALMPLPIMLAHWLAKRLADVRKTRLLPFLRPDGKTQVTVEYEAGVPVRVPTLVVSAQHTAEVSQASVKEAIVEEVIRHVVAAHLLHNTEILVNPTGRFVIGGPVGDSGLTGRKIIVDTYGGASRHGGGALSGKDPTKVDRSGAYAARQAAKSVVAAGLARRCELQIAYAIGIPEPVSLLVETFGTGRMPDDQLAELVERSFDLTPHGILDRLQLRRPIYQRTAAYGHFGREGFPWEEPVALTVPAAVRIERA